MAYLLFYIIALVVVASTFMAVTNRNMVHAVLFLVVGFLGTALIFYMLGAPFLAGMQVIIYAGAIMVVFLFIVMMMKISPSAKGMTVAHRTGARVLFGVSAVFAGIMAFSAGPLFSGFMETATAPPAAFGHYVFKRHWFSVEIASMLLLVVLAGVLILGKPHVKQEDAADEQPGEVL